MATQVQIRRDSAANLTSATPVVGEAGYDTTNKNLLVGDGSRVGGIPHVSYAHDQTQRFRYGTVGGTADAITLALNEDLDAYVEGVAVEFKAGSTNTGSVTIDVSGLGTKTIRKMSGGSLQNLSAGDIVSGSVYRLVYDGTYFQISSGLSGGGLVITRQVFTSSGTWNKPTGLLYADVEVVGGGGGGGGNGAVGVNGSTGGTSAFGAHCSATGGTGGVGASSSSGLVTSAGVSGVGSSGDINTYSTNGHKGIMCGSSANTYGGNGGSSFYGAGGNGGNGIGFGSNGTTGAGGGGSSYFTSTTSFAACGGGGSGGYCKKIIVAASLSATETVTVGASGAGGNGTNTDGGAGGSGIVIVTEYKTA